MTNLKRQTTDEAVDEQVKVEGAISTNYPSLKKFLEMELWGKSWHGRFTDLYKIDTISTHSYILGIKHVRKLLVENGLNDESLLEEIDLLMANSEQIV